MVLQQLPLTPNGKVDKRALPMPDAVRSAAGYVPPGTPAEQTLAEIWADLLGLDKVGIHDNFFSLGGHSLLSVEVFQEIEHRLGVGLPVAMIFAAPTIASLADMIDAGRHAKSLLVPLQIEGDGTPLFCIHPVGGQVSFYRSLAESLRGRCPVYGIQSPEAAGLSLQFGSLDDMASAYCTAILDAQTEGPYRLAGWSTGGLIAMAVAAELEKRGCEVGYLGLLDTSPILAEVKTSQTQLTMGASLTALASIRGNSFTEAELASMQKVLSENAMSVADFFSDTHQMLALPFLEQWTGIAMTVDLWQHLKRQITSSTHHLELLAGFAPPALRAAWHIYSPEEFDQAVDRDLPVFVDRKSDWRLTAGSMEIVQGNHYNMLAAPHVESLAERMASRLCGETSLLNMRHTAPDLPACSCSR
jgi:thioesterase domain-containing protein/acyl carrier protein